MKINLNHKFSTSYEINELLSILVFNNNIFSMEKDLQQSIKELTERSQELSSHVEGIMSRISADTRELFVIAEKLKDLPDIAKNALSHIDFNGIAKSVEKFQEVMSNIDKPEGIAALAQKLAGHTK